MASGAAETVIGAVVIGAAVAFAVYAGQSSGFSMDGGGGYDLAADFRSAEGISAGTEVRLAGIKVGTVTGLELNPDTYLARATLNLREDLLIPDDSDVKIASESLLGGAFVEITPGASEFMLGDGDEIVNTQSSVSLLNLLMRFGAGQ